MPFIKNFNDLIPVFDKGVAVVFRDPRKYFYQGNLLIGQTDERRYYPNAHYEIWIQTNDQLYKRKYAPHKTSLLEEQQVSLVHELIHAVNKLKELETGLGSFKSPSGKILYYNRTYEIRIDIESYRLIRTGDFLEKVVMAIVARPNCCFIYEANNTPLF